MNKRQKALVKSFAAKYRPAVREHIKQKTQVFIDFNNDTGFWQHSVCVLGTDFWLASFKTEKAALRFVKECGFPLACVLHHPKN